MERGFGNNVCCCFLYREQKIGLDISQLQDLLLNQELWFRRWLWYQEEFYYGYMVKGGYFEEVGMWGLEGYSENGSWVGQIGGYFRLGM